jgi:hypothetical protein
MSPEFPIHVLMEGEPLDNMTVLEADKYLVRSHLRLLIILLVILVVVLKELVLEDVLVVLVLAVVEQEVVVGRHGMVEVAPLPRLKRQEAAQ